MRQSCTSETREGVGRKRVGGTTIGSIRQNCSMTAEAVGKALPDAPGTLQLGARMFGGEPGRFAIRRRRADDAGLHAFAPWLEHAVKFEDRRGRGQRYRGAHDGDGQFGRNDFGENWNRRKIESQQRARPSGSAGLE